MDDAGGWFILLLVRIRFYQLWIIYLKSKSRDGRHVMNIAGLYSFNGTIQFQNGKLVCSKDLTTAMKRISICKHLINITTLAQLQRIGDSGDPIFVSVVPNSPLKYQRMKRQKKPQQQPDDEFIGQERSIQHLLDRTVNMFDCGSPQSLQAKMVALKSKVALYEKERQDLQEQHILELKLLEDERNETINLIAPIESRIEDDWSVIQNI